MYRNNIFAAGAGIGPSVAAIALVVSTLFMGRPAHAGPVRLTRFSVVSGDVTWRRDPGAAWSDASINLPIREGVQILVGPRARAELQFDDGSYARLGAHALVTLQTLYSDRDGEFTELTLNDGTCVLRVRDRYAVFQVNTPSASLKAVGPARCRLDVGARPAFEVWQGAATIEGPQGRIDLRSGDRLDVRDTNAPYTIVGLPARDSFDTWCANRDRLIDENRATSLHHAVSAQVALVADDLSIYGTWRHDRRCGEVWCPRVHTAAWRPYAAGRWVWVDPYGWTWVSDEPWGWAPYHYGTWVHLGFGWAWCPGPRYQYWSPAVVDFTVYNGSVAWCPLAPSEVVYPSTTLAVGFGGGDWSAYFSIGQAAQFYPSPRHVWVADPWSTDYVNRVTYVNNTTIIGEATVGTQFAVNRNTFVSDPYLVPANARFGGAVLASSSALGGRGTYRLAPGASAVGWFAHGRTVAAPVAGAMPAAGPAIVRPSLVATTTTRTFRSSALVPAAVLTRAVYRAPVAPVIARVGAPLARTVPVNHSPRIWTRSKASAAMVSARSTTAPQARHPFMPSGGSAAERAAGARTALRLPAGPARLTPAARMARPYPAARAAATSPHTRHANTTSMTPSGRSGGQLGHAGRAQAHAAFRSVPSARRAEVAARTPGAEGRRRATYAPQHQSQRAISRATRMGAPWQRQATAPVRHSARTSEPGFMRTRPSPRAGQPAWTRSAAPTASTHGGASARTASTHSHQPREATRPSSRRQPSGAPGGGGHTPDPRTQGSKPGHDRS